MKLIYTILTLALVLGVRAESESSVKIGRPMITSAPEPVTVDITIDNSDRMPMGGFDLYLIYDSCLSFQSAVAGSLLTSCGWEYFTYSTQGVNEIRIVAMADINNGSSHPSCYADTSGILARLNFYADVDPLVGTDFLAVRFMWYDCGDNTISSLSGDSLFISHDVYYFNGIFDELMTTDTTFPTTNGAPDQCLPNPRLIDFYSGGVYAIFNDTTPPTALCPEDIFVPADPDQCGAEVFYEAEVGDNSPGATISCSPPSGSNFSVGSSIITCTAVDIFDNMDTCRFSITVQDTQPPVVNCPADTTAAADSGFCNASVAYTASVTDNCPGSYITCSPPPISTFPAGTTAVTCIGIDAAGNADTGFFNITVIDTQSPVIQCPDSVVLPTEPGLCGAQVTYDITADDNCSQVSIECDHASDSFYSVGVTPVTCIATDAAGNADTGGFEITVIDTQPPTALVTEDIIIENEPGVCGAHVYFTPEVSDNCPGATISCLPPSGALFPVRPLTVVCAAIDAAGNTDSAAFTVTVIDTQPPVVLAPPDINIPNDPGQCGAIVDFEPEISDNCSGASVICHPPSGSFFPTGIGEITCVGSDISGNADTALFSVMVADTSRPELTCPADIEVFNDSGSYGATIFYSPTATDNCGQVNLMVTPPSGSFFNVGSHEIDVIATDEVGNASVCSFSVKVVLNDPDMDRIASWEDNCPDTFNPDQSDADGDGIGDVCDWRYGDANNDDNIDVGDAVFIIGYVFSGGPGPEPEQAGDANCDGQSNIADAVYLINFIFSEGNPPGC